MRRASFSVKKEIKHEKEVIRSDVRPLRGGSWDSGARFVRSADRNSNTPSGRNSYVGFRLVRP
jgi:formylglycine-generating enzyme required for sulfatase activity